MVLSIKEEQYVAAARTVGCSDWRIMWRHILPNATAPLIVQATVSVSYAILAEATLSFLGLGVEADTLTWGLISPMPAASSRAPGGSAFSRACSS